MKIDICKSIPKDNRKIIHAAIKASHAHAPMKTKKIKVFPIKLNKNYSGVSSVQGKTAILKIKLDEDYLDTIFHECYHVHQIGTGELTQEVGGFKWYGIFIPIELYKMFYGFIPFERSAYKFAKSMCEKLEQI